MTDLTNVANDASFAGSKKISQSRIKLALSYRVKSIRVVELVDYSIILKSSVFILMSLSIFSNLKQNRRFFVSISRDNFSFSPFFVLLPLAVIIRPVAIRHCADAVPLTVLPTASVFCVSYAVPFC